jgi:hypothetical protein
MRGLYAGVRGHQMKGTIRVRFGQPVASSLTPGRAAFFLQGLDQGVHVFHSVVDHERRRPRSKLLTFLRSDEAAVVPATVCPATRSSKPDGYLLGS